MQNLNITNRGGIVLCRCQVAFISGGTLQQQSTRLTNQLFGLLRVPSLCPGSFVATHGWERMTLQHQVRHSESVSMFVPAASQLSVPDWHPALHLDNSGPWRSTGSSTSLKKREIQDLLHFETYMWHHAIKQWASTGGGLTEILLGLFGPSIGLVKVRRD